ncbi:MAG: hypothetical protein WBG73_03425 [Coleofasciculaceae cyanobacterium]
MPSESKQLDLFFTFNYGDSEALPPKADRTFQSLSLKWHKIRTSRCTPKSLFWISDSKCSLEASQEKSAWDEYLFLRVMVV